MIQLFKVHHQFLFTKKVVIVTLILLIISYMIMLLQSNLLGSVSDLEIHRAFYLTGYIYNGLNLIKIVVVLYAMLLNIYAFYINNYDVFLISRSTKKQIISTKLIVVISNVFLFSMNLMLFYSLLWVLLDSNVSVWILLDSFLKIVLFSVYYTMFYAFVIINLQNLFIMFLPFMGYFISNLSIDYGLRIEELNTFSRVINVIFPDLIVIKGLYYYIYGGLFVFGFGLLLFVGTIRSYVCQDMKM